MTATGAVARMATSKDGEMLLGTIGKASEGKHVMATYERWMRRQGLESLAALSALSQLAKQISSGRS